MKQRSISTKFWSDNWTREKLNPLDRYLFLYFLTNEHTNYYGIYELPLVTIAFETGIDKEDLVKAMLPRLEPKIYYKEGWVIIPNFPKHQNFSSPQLKIGLEREIANLPSQILEKAIGYGYGIDTVWVTKLNLTKLKVGPPAPQSPIGKETPEDNEMPQPEGLEVKQASDRLDRRKTNLKLIFELSAMARRITGREFLKDGKLALKQLKELEELAKDGDKFKFNADRIKAEWIELCNEWAKADEDSYIRKYGFNLGTIRKKISNKGI